MWSRTYFNRVILIKSLGKDSSARYSSNYEDIHFKMVSLGTIYLVSLESSFFIRILSCIQIPQRVSRSCLSNSIVVGSLPNCLLYLDASFRPSAMLHPQLSDLLNIHGANLCIIMAVILV